MPKRTTVKQHSRRLTPKLSSLNATQQKSKLFNNAGVYIDGANGLDWTRLRMIDLLENVGTSSAKMVISQLEVADSEDINDLLDAATELLQMNTDRKFIWVWDAGDLILTDNSDDF